MTKALQREQQQQRRLFHARRQRLDELWDMRLAAKFGAKESYSDEEHAAVYDELDEVGLSHEAICDPAAAEAFDKKLNAAFEAEAVRRDLGG